MAIYRKSMPVNLHGKNYRAELRDNQLIIHYFLQSIAGEQCEECA